MTAISSREKFFDFSIDMLCVADFRGYFLDVNLAFTRVLGYSREELLSQPYLSFIHPEDVNATARENSLVESGKQTQLHFENRYRHKDGHYLTLSWSSITDNEAGVVYGIARDVTAAANARNRLLQIEKALEQGALVIVTDAEGAVLSANDAVCRVTEFGKDELEGHSFTQLSSHLASSPALTKLQQDLALRKVASGTVEGRTKSGKRFAVQVVATPIFDHQGALSGFIAIGHDSTASLRAEESLARTIGILNETNAIAKVGGWELNVATGELEWTDETFRILEVERKHGRKPMLPEGLLLFTPESQPLIERAVSRAIEFGEPYSLELEAQTAKGNVLWVYTNGKPNYKDGKIVTLSGTIQDIHARKTAELLYEQERRTVLRQAKMATLGELSAAMAHELSNPLAIISAAAEVALTTPDIPEGVEDSLNDIMKSCSRMSHIIQKLGRFSRTEQNRPVHEVHAIRSIVEESLVLVAPRLKQALVQVFVEARSEATLKCSSIEIEQVLVNLLNNAIDAVKHLNERWIKIQVIEGERHLELEVIDSGQGVPESILDEIFTPFRTTKAPGEGTGLGLAISRQIVQEHGGVLDCDRSNRNTCFKVILPRDFKEGADAA